MRAPVAILCACLGLLGPWLACGDGGSAVDAGLADAPHDDVAPPDGAPDAPLRDGAQADIQTDAAACDPAGGQLAGGLCLVDLDCGCPRLCLKLEQPPATGSCWTSCDPAATDPATGRNPGCLDTEACTAGAAGVAGCLPLGTLSGTFAVPVFTPPDQPQSAADVGAALVTLTVGSIGTMVFESGFGTLYTRADGTSFHRLMLFPGAGATIDWDKPLFLDLAADATYAAGATYDLAADAERAAVAYHELVTDLYGTLARDVVRAFAPSGTVHLTAAGTGGRAPAEGDLVGGVVVQYEIERCGDSSAPCTP